MKTRFWILYLIAVLSIFLTKSNANAQWGKSYIDSLAVGILSPATVADIQNDGDLDILATRITDFENFTGEIVWYEAPDWTAHLIDDDWGISKSFDVNGDNQPDIIAANYAAEEVVWYEAPNWNRHVIASGIQGVANIDIVDMNNDNAMDIIAGSISTGIVWYEAPTRNMHQIVQDISAFWFITSDIDNDNDLDVILSNDNGIYFYEAPTWAVHSISNIPDGRGQLAVGDIDGDSDLDVVITEAEVNEIAFYENPSWTRHIVDSLRNPIGIKLVDMDKDNDLDIVASGRGNESINGTVVWFELPEWTKHTIDGSFTGASGITAADVNGDEMPDLIVCSVTDNSSGSIVLYTSPLISRVSKDISAAIPDFITLNQNFPNPFNPETNISYELQKNTHVRLKIYNLSGQCVTTLVDEENSRGFHCVNWNGKDDSGKKVASGIFMYTLEAENVLQVKKMILIQ